MGIQSRQWLDIWVQTTHNSKYWFSYYIPLSADFTQADVQDNQMYPTITCSSSLPQGVRYMAVADSGYDIP